MNLVDALAQLDTEIIDGAIEALHLKKIGCADEAKVLEEEVASLRRQARTLHLRGLYDVTGSPVPDVGDVPHWRERFDRNMALLQPPHQVIADEAEA